MSGGEPAWRGDPLPGGAASRDAGATSGARVWRGARRICHVFANLIMGPAYGLYGRVLARAVGDGPIPGMSASFWMATGGSAVPAD